MASSSAMNGPAPVIWLLTDNKPGHRNQLKGLGNRLRVLTGASIHWLETEPLAVPLWRALFGAAPSLDNTLPRPNLVIAAGSGTHRLLLSLRHIRGCQRVVLMKPAFPLALVDAAIIPEHDRVAESRRVLTTQGVLNAVTPMARVTEKPEALILIGGPSRHFEWDNISVFDQTLQLMSNHPQWRWTISSSRRTPKELTDRLATLESPRVTVVTPETTHESWLNHQLAGSRAVWVTPDSTSMVYEAITSGVPTGLLELLPNPDSRLAAGIHHAVELGLAGLWQDQASVMHPSGSLPVRLWEADRAARWLIQTLPAWTNGGQS
ncbi:mitochondrial fission ELM1 family protein [Marinobacter zhejiangensis]|uniref:Fission protein ELM1 n=1 Tax=Marinobacter zhejiangensis TaxID=488535 RepID=A0A1I4SBT0_9GAMM|nr:ELM1/GtrOC1 family putative glycosyltransferase [Marinobacter zhejiangensis]SFM61932.1 hypothetical protein SAMN04487963_3133 [Marinobacter zhejiangensis]